MSFRRTGLGLLFALAAGCGQAPPPAANPSTGAGPGSLARPLPPPSPVTTSTPAEAPAPPPPPEEGADSETRDPRKNDSMKGATGPAPVAPPRAATAAATFNGSMTQADIRDVVMKHADVFDDCYKIGAGKSRQFVATVTVKATVGPMGNVNASEILKSTSKNKQVGICVAEAFKKMKFPRPKGGATSVITFPIDFNGEEQIQ